jgi:hypothetical protein
MSAHSWTDDEKQALTPGTPLVLMPAGPVPNGHEIVLFDSTCQDGSVCLVVRVAAGPTAPFSYAWDRLRPMDMQWASPGARPDEFALQQARIRRLEKDLGLEKEKTARERKANGELALLVHEARCHAAGLDEEISKLRAEKRALFDAVKPALLIPDSDTPGSLIEAALRVPGVADLEDGEPTRGDYVAKPPEMTRATIGDRVRVLVKGVPLTGGLRDHGVAVVLSRFEGEHYCRFDEGPLRLSRLKVTDAEILEVLPAEQPEDALARDCGAP